MIGPCEHGNKNPGSIKGGEFLNQLRDYHSEDHVTELFLGY